MSVDNVRNLSVFWQKDEVLQSRINQVFDRLDFTDEYVKYLADRERLIPRKSKQIKDNQWGMIELDWRAVRLIDCPLVQRLRFVKQLGFTYLTYPSAEHSRFSHSVGVAHVVSKFIDAINKRANDTKPYQTVSETSFVSIDNIQNLSPHDLIHAAILHDIGHLPFSHVTEKVI